MDTEQAAIKKVFCLIPAVSMAFFKPFEQHNSHPELGRSHLRTLINLRLDGPSSMTHLSQRIELEKGSFTPVARHLEEAGYLERVKPPEDRRQTLLSLTPEGMRLTDELMAEHRRFVEASISQLSAQEKAEFLMSVDTMLRLLQRMKQP